MITTKATYASSIPPGHTKKVDKRVRAGGYSEFFRVGGMADFWPQFQSRLAEMMERKPEKIKILVAGCSEGEEAYSIAMLLQTLYPNRAAEVMGIDRDENRLTKARQGTYYRSDYRLDPSLAVPEQYKSFFVGIDGKGADLFSVRPEIRDQVNFRRADLLDAAPAAAADIVIAHNLITANRSQQDRVLPACVEWCCQGGLVFLNNDGFYGPIVRAMNNVEILFQSGTDMVLKKQ
jgi:chemotaxis methyl-accepting protein methylase